MIHTEVYDEVHFEVEDFLLEDLMLIYEIFLNNFLVEIPDEVQEEKNLQIFHERI